MESNTQKLIHAFEALADLGQEVASASDFNEMVRTSLHVLLGTLAIRRGAVVACMPGRDSLECIALWGLGDEFPIQLTVTAPEREQFPGAGLCHVTQNGNSPFSDFLNRHQTELQNYRLELIAPMAGRGKLSGLVVLGSKASDEPFTEDDLEIIRAMVRHIGVGIHTHRLLGQIEQRAEENRRLYEDLRTIYKDTVRAFATAIDIKDKYTKGHSERVGKYSEIIARELGWTEEAVEGIAIAGYLHDIGKLVVERDIINAPYKIDAKASKDLNRHPVAGFEILSPIQHPYADIPLMAKYHHERLDGNGYPDGLMGDEIPFGAKIVTLADSFDAMTTDRPYRTRLSFEDVIQDFRRNTGTQFDSQVVVAFSRALLKEVTGAVKERRIVKMLGKNYLDSDRAIPLLANLIADLDPNTQSAAAGNLA